MNAEIDPVIPEEYVFDFKGSWDRLDDESKDQYMLFAAYRDMGNRRSIRAIVDITGLSRSRIQPMAVRHSWSDRADQYDVEVARIALKALEGDDSQSEMRNRHAGIARVLVEKAGAAAAMMDPAFLAPRDLPVWLDVAAKLERASKGLLDTKRLEVTGKGGDPIKIVNEMSADERRELMREARAELDRRLGKPEIEAIIEDAEIVEDE